MDNVFTLDTKIQNLLADQTRGTITDEMSFIELKDKNNRNVRFSIDCELVGDLNDGEYGHSILTRINNDASVASIETIEDLASSTLPESIEFKPFIKDQKFFLKLKQKGDKYKAIIDPPCSPAQTDKTPFLRGSNIVIECTISMWINYKNAVAGLFLNVSKITIDGGRRKAVKRR